MSLTTLPEEVFDIIIFELDVEDVINVFSVVGCKRSEGFWKKLCLRNGFHNVHGEEESWKEVFLRNVNWLRGTYLKNVFIISDLSVGLTPSRDGNPEDNNVRGTLSDNLPDNSAFKFILKGNKLVSQAEDGVVIRNVETPQELKQKLKGSVCLKQRNQSMTKLLVREQSHLIIYSCEKELCEELFVLEDSRFNLTSVLTDDYFAFLELDKKNVTVVDLLVKEKYSLPISSKREYMITFTMFIWDHVLHIIMLNHIKYILRRYHLQRREWLEDFTLFGRAVMLGDPHVEMNSRVLVAWSGFLDRSGGTLKVWTTEDASAFPASTFSPLPSSVALDGVACSLTQILWVLLEDIHVIYSLSNPIQFNPMKEIFIFNVKEPKKTNKIALTADDCLGRSVTSGLLILSYSRCFKVIDVKKATVLYEVLFDTGFYCLEFCVNDYYYMAYYLPVHLCSHKLFIYDFRGKELNERNLDY